MRSFAFLNTKGGVGKTTSAVGVAAVWHGMGHRVGLIDCDSNQSATAWLEEWGAFDATPSPADLVETIVGAAAGQYDLLVIDTPPNLKHEIETIAAAVDFVVIPSAPTRIDLHQLQSVIEVLNGTGTPWVVVPTQVKGSTTSGRTIRAVCAEAGLPVTQSIVPDTERTAQAFGQEPPRLSFVALAQELLELCSEVEHV